MTDAIHVKEVRIHRTSPAYGDVVLSNGQTLGKVLGIEMTCNAGESAEMLIRVKAVTVHVDEEREGRGQTLAPSGT